MNFKNILNFFGLWSYPFGLIISSMVYYLIEEFQMESLVLDEKSIKVILIGGLIAPFFIMLLNIYDYLSKDKRDFTPNFSFKKDVTKISDSKKQAMYKKVEKSDGLLLDQPDGLVFGKQGKKFVTLPIGKMRDGVSAIILGSPGSGKSVFLTNFLLNNFMQKNPTPVFCLDIKPELARKSVMFNENKNVKIVDFTDRSKAGWDVYYALNSNSKDDEKMRVFDSISKALIKSTNPKDKFFVVHAQTIFKTILLYYFNLGMGFVDSLTKIISEDVSGHIKKILDDRENCPEGSLVRNSLNKYDGKDSDAMQDVELTLQQNLQIFLNSDIRYQLRDNPIKANPEDLNNGLSIFVCMPMFLLSEMESLLTLLSTQVIFSMEQRSENQKQGVILILDELARIGKLDNLLPFLAVCRSLQVSVLMAYQSFSQLQSIYSESDSKTLFDLAEIIYVLSIKDNSSCKMLSDLIGDFQEEKVSHNRSELLHCSDGKQNVSNEYRRILEVSDFQSLRDKKEAILYIYGKSFRIKQFRYFEYPPFLKRYNEVIEANKKTDEYKTITINDKGEINYEL